MPPLKPPWVMFVGEDAETGRERLTPPHTCHKTLMLDCFYFEAAFYFKKDQFRLKYTCLCVLYPSLKIKFPVYFLFLIPKTYFTAYFNISIMEF